jgi:hypothetical protein
MARRQRRRGWREKDCQEPMGRRGERWVVLCGHEINKRSSCRSRSGLKQGHGSKRGRRSATLLNVRRGRRGIPGSGRRRQVFLAGRCALAALDGDAVREWCPSCRARVPIASRVAADRQPRKQTLSGKSTEQQQPHPRHGDTARRGRRALQHGARDAALPPVRAPARDRGLDRRPQSSAVGAVASAFSPLHTPVLTLRLVYP